jgi:DNA ligase 1
MYELGEYMAEQDSKTLLATLVEASNQTAATASRLKKQQQIATLLRQVSPDEIDLAVSYLAGEARQGRTGISFATLKAAIESAPANDPTLTLGDVDRSLNEIVAIKGSGSTAKRAAAVKQLFSLATAAERDFLWRLITGELRQGALAGVMLDAIAVASAIDSTAIRRAAMYAPALGAVARAAFTEGVAGLARFQLQPMHPIAPMLAQTAADVDEALELFAGEVAFEWKMDGARIQVHKVGDDVRIYTRSLNDVSHAVPEIVAQAQAFGPHTLVLDGEAIVFSPAGRPVAFQTTMRRFGRKLDVDALREELPIRAFYFDCLRMDELTLADKSMRERIESLRRAIPTELLMPQLLTRERDVAQRFYEAALAAGHEGVMAKALDAPYEAGNRGASWLKIKRAHTLDLVVLAAEWGHGRRRGKLSNLHLGALDANSGEYVMLGKTFKGLTDAMLEWQTQEFLAREVRRDDWTVYVRPEIVVEVAFSDIQASPRYPAGLALRLARVKRYRPDKRAEDADSLDAVRLIFERQG